jgi:hypothetical protein
MKCQSIDALGQMHGDKNIKSLSKCVRSDHFPGNLHLVPYALRCNL